jgi:hypothetical protein
MGSLADELKKNIERQEIVAEQPTKAVVPPTAPVPLRTDDWHLNQYACALTGLCEDLENKLLGLARGLEQYKPIGPKEMTLKPGVAIKDIKGSVKELLAKTVNARRIASGVQSELQRS